MKLVGGGFVINRATSSSFHDDCTIIPWFPRFPQYFHDIFHIIYNCHMQSSTFCRKQSIFGRKSFRKKLCWVTHEPAFYTSGLTPKKLSASWFLIRPRHMTGDRKDTGKDKVWRDMHCSPMRYCGLRILEAQTETVTFEDIGIHNKADPSKLPITSRLY